MADWVIVVDDDVSSLKVAGYVLSKNGMRVTALKSGAALFDYLQHNGMPDLCLLDVNMPGMNGFETFKKLREVDSEVPVIFLTADEADMSEAKGLSLGAMDFIKKPFIPEVLILRVRHTIELVRLQKNLAQEVAAKNEDNYALFVHVILALTEAIDAKDIYTNGHSARVAKYAREIARRYGYDEKRQNDMYVMGLLHDVGKIGVPDSIITKSDKLTKEEFEELRPISQIVISPKGGGRQKLPFVFTEQGVAMLSAVLHSNKAINVSINIMNAFVEMRKYISTNGQVLEKLANMENNLTSVNYKLLDHDKKFDIVFDELQEKKKQEEKQRIFFDGQIWDAYKLIIDIIKKAERKILIIDNYIDDSVLEMLTKKKENVEVIILTSNNSNISKLDVQKFNKEYPILKIARTNKFHDRFIVIDNKELYHYGASLKDLGKKCFGINRIEDAEYIQKLDIVGMF